jgi:hypothetical protein
MSITLTKKGGRRIELFLPFTHGGVDIDAIELAPVSWKHTRLWQRGKYTSSTELMFELAGITEALFDEVKYPDVNRVVMQFMDLLPEEIRDDIATGRVPTPLDLEQVNFQESEPEPEPEPEPLPEPGPESQKPEDWPADHVETTDPDTFNKAEWEGILPERKKPEAGIGFDLAERP